MEKIKRARLKGDWKRIQDSEFYVEFMNILRNEEKKLIQALRAESNDRDKDMWIKGKLFELNIVYGRLATLVKSLGENLG